MSVQPTTDEPVRVVLKGFFNTLNDLNDALADEINVLLQAPPSQAKEVFPKAEFAFRELEYLINDLAIIIADERKKIEGFKLFPILLRAHELAKDSEALKQEVSQHQTPDPPKQTQNQTPKTHEFRSRTPSKVTFWKEAPRRYWMICKKPPENRTNLRS